MIILLNPIQIKREVRRILPRMGSNDQGAPSPRVFIVEDDSPTLRLYEEAFREVDSSVQIESVRDGEKALTLLTESVTNATPPDVVVLDLDLPKLHGTDVLRKLRERDHLSKISVVVISGNDDQETIDRCYQLGANSYIVKPEDYDELLEAARRVSTYWGQDQVRYPSP